MTFLHIEDIHIDAHQRWAERLTLAMGKRYLSINADDLTTTSDPDLFSTYLQEQGVDLIFISAECDKRIVQRFLNACRSLRIPYVFLTPEMRKMPVLAEMETSLHTILAPVTMLEEEVYKAEILGHLSRFTNADIYILRAKDYGHRAEHNAGKIRTFLEHQSLPSRTLIARKDSLSLHKELPLQAKEQTADLIVLTASREYGLDDLIFGPAERYVILHSPIPVLLLNPRDDLFSLCD